MARRRQVDPSPAATLPAGNDELQAVVRRVHGRREDAEQVGRDERRGEDDEVHAAERDRRLAERTAVLRRPDEQRDEPGHQVDDAVDGVDLEQRIAAPAHDRVVDEADQAGREQRDADDVQPRPRDAVAGHLVADPGIVAVRLAVGTQV